MEWTKAELDRFDRLTRKMSSLKQMDRIMARLEIKRFVESHGKAKCDAMFAALKKRDARKHRGRDER